MLRRFKPPWTAEHIPGGYVVKDATSQSLTMSMSARRRRKTRVALEASEPKPVSRIKNPRPKQEFAKPKREQRIRLASARADDSVASIMERAFGRN
jgi:hypothetical protein